ncbi:P-loop containing nucleoside triphosphate hydrolase protein [Trametes coccinea BRFM310]|uniref:p-loop containing nucleoside triphosphate hydrolase protein n=1 Tax=Trametes coccinea (strain BRFM310) TaxID=1353009 RepID=A0A1Y2IFU7_TRAC3|nr:P-loop containing nucleoside triphosphate hydrolase protein [Trametes coccinea BRFM310]
MLGLRARVLVVQPLRWTSASTVLARHVSSPPCSHRPPVFAVHHLARRPFSSSCHLRESAPAPPLPPSPNTSGKPSEGKKSILSRFVPADAQDKTKNVSSFRKIVALAKPERKPLGIAVGLLLVSSAVSMSIPFTVGKLIDFFTSTNPQIPLGLSLGQASAVLLLLFTAGGLANAGRAMLMRLSGQRIVARLRERTYAAALRQEVEFVERGEGDILSRLSADSSIVGESVTQNLSDGLRSVVMASAGLGAMFYISPTLTLLMLTVVPPISLGVVFYGRYLKKLSNRTQEALGDMTKVAQEALSALRTVQAFNAAPQEQEKFHQKINNVLTLARKEAIASGIFFGATGWSGNVTLLALLGYGGTLVSKGAISVGDLTSLLLYTVYVGSGLQMLTSFFSSIMRGVGAGVRIFDLLDRQPAIPPDVGVEVDRSRRGPIRFEHVWFEYPSRRNVQILKDLNLEVAMGESVALVGQSGSGKSSINALLMRYYDPIKGKVTFDGQDIREFKPSSWRSIIGVVPQDPILFTGTIASNIAYGNPDATREQIEAAAREANCEFVWGMPQGFDTEIGRTSLSGGQRQRLAIARALLKKPAILALDEATSSLDATSEHRVNDAIDKILRKRQTTCLIVAHRLSTIARAERIVVLEDGRITETGTYRELVNKADSRFRHLMAAQLDAAAGESLASGVSVPADQAPSTEEVAATEEQVKA